ncbi:response regulator transcription factor [Sulfurospirillum barnesii]|uniref:Response regulator with CheY-like receiver domain and winged-helix DNA-binding domain n=1 Tax=Sulfurospirillum barnesii (strain ATCC 700032 / DSM 10660 / SES-3) TaxID=760154 RepID=I3XZD9_SULBS|nr:response regulator transcription factor [Sulfurospirillum barnesii]AFL69313.1 response regulator with CheY-like receiver domain and winged-helix DNA-binding domain [Sulfurospirillum barnesii SES-3]
MSGLSKLTVLFVEDEEYIREALHKAMADEFHKCILARDGEDGLKKFKKYKPDIVITDIMMPIMDGLSMAKEIKHLSKTTPIVVLSAFSEKEKLLEAIDVGIDKYLIKPIDPEELLDVLHFLSAELFNEDACVDLGFDYQFDKNRRVLVKEGNTIFLTKKELLFISILVKNLGVFVLHDEIKKHVWTNKKVTDSAIRTFIKRVREKTDKDFIKNIPGLGYKINTQER